jgi:ubiquinone/menaquinone biosynthesis C-methylase UbiE
MNEHERQEMYKKTFDTIAQDYDNPATRFFAQSVPHLIAHLDLKGDENILDVATGTGNAAIELSRHLPHGQVRGIDFSKAMLAKAEEKKEALGIDNVQFLEMDMQAIQFPDGYFDMAVCSFSLFFAKDMVGQIGHMANKVKPGGKVVTTSFYQNLFAPQVDLFLNHIDRYGVVIPPMTWKHTDTTQKCRALFQKAGLADIVTYQKDLGYYLAHPEQWWEIVWNAGYRGLINQLCDTDLAKFKKTHLMEIAALANGNGLWLDIEVIYTIGTKRR